MHWLVTLQHFDGVLHREPLPLTAYVDAVLPGF